MSEFVENVTLKLEHYEQLKKKSDESEYKLKEMQDELNKTNEQIDKFIRPLSKLNISVEQYKEFLKQIEQGNFETFAEAIDSPENPMTFEIGYTIKIKRERG